MQTEAKKPTTSKKGYDFGDLTGRVIGDCLVEIKARKELLREDFVQTLSYLKASEYPVALLINFGAEKIEVKRLVGLRNQVNYPTNE